MLRLLNVVTIHTYTAAVIFFFIQLVSSSVGEGSCPRRPWSFHDYAQASISMARDLIFFRIPRAFVLSFVFLYLILTDPLRIQP